MATAITYKNGIATPLMAVKNVSGMTPITGKDFMLFSGRNCIPFYYSPYNYKRSSGYHRGVDVYGMDSDIIYSPLNGTVKTATIITNHNNATWEWGYYLRIDDAQGRKHFFCHLKSFKVKAGDKVVIGQPIAVMGCTGNAALASPPIPHVHYEVRTSKNAYCDPTQWLSLPNRVGIYTLGAESLKGKKVTLTANLNLRDTPAATGGTQGVLKSGSTVTVREEKDGFVHLEGWVSKDYVEVQK